MAYKSQLDGSGERSLSQQSWVVGIFRQEGSANKEHAFLMVEGLNQTNQVVFRRYDLFTGENFDPAKKDCRDFQIRIKEMTVSQEEAASTLHGGDFLKDAKTSDQPKGRTTLGKTWNITQQKAHELQENVEASKESPGPYNLLGIDASLPSSAAFCKEYLPKIAMATSNGSVDFFKKKSPQTGELLQEVFSDPGHSCFTWARWQLFQLKIDPIKNDMPKKAIDLVGAISSKHIDDEPSSGGNCLLM